MTRGNAFEGVVDADGSKPKHAVLYLTDVEWEALALEAKARGIARNTMMTKLLRQFMKPNAKLALPPKKPTPKSRARSIY